MTFRKMLIGIYISVLLILIIYSAAVWSKVSTISLSIKLSDSYNGIPLLVPIKFVLKQEHWVFVHFFVPFTFAIFCSSFFKAISIIFAWESFEAICATIGSLIVISSRWTSSFFSEWIRESIGDSLIGDIAIGLVGILFGRYFMCNYFPCLNELLKIGHVCRISNLKAVNKGCNCRFFKRHKILLLFLLYFVSGAWAEVVAGLVFHYNSSNGIGLPIGYLMYPFIRLLWLEIFWNHVERHLVTRKTSHEIEGFVIMITFVFIWVYLSSFFLLTISYPVVFFGIGTCFLALIFLLNK